MLDSYTTLTSHIKWYFVFHEDPYTGYTLVEMGRDVDIYIDAVTILKIAKDGYDWSHGGNQNNDRLYIDKMELFEGDTNDPSIQELYDFVVKCIRNHNLETLLE